MTREGSGTRSHVLVRQGDEARFPQTDPVSGDGANSGRRWLPPVEVSRHGLMSVIELIKANQNNMTKHLGQAAAFGASLTDTGCWVSGEFTARSLEHGWALWQLAELDIKHEVLDTVDEIYDIHVCDEPGCLNPRHYNFTPKIEHRQRKSYPEYEHFKADSAAGIIMPSWYSGTGEHLQSVEESVASFLELRSQCEPYTDGKNAPLSANGISKILVNRVTGCWEVQTYYLKPLNDESRLQSDGYARLGVGKGLQKRGLRNQQRMAHRIMAIHYGIITPAEDSDKKIEINHRCGTRNCCNPNHLEKSTRSRNIDHSKDMQEARRLAAAGKISQLVGHICYTKHI